MPTSTRHASEPDTAPEAGMSRDIVNIPENVILEGIRQYSQADQDDILWLFAHATRDLANSRSRLCENMQTDWTTILRVATGKYNASIASFMARVRALKTAVLEGGSTGFVTTPVTRKIFETLDYALAGDQSGGRMVEITGESRRSKTESVKEWVRTHSSQATYIDVPGEGGIRGLLQEMASGFRINHARKTNDLRERILSCVNRRRILIFDEVSRLFTSRRPRIVELDFIRRLHDVQRCSIALVCTPVVDIQMRGAEFRPFLEQFIGRIEEPLVLPSRVLRSETLEICRHFAKAAPSKALLDLANRIANEPGKLGLLFPLMRQASLLAGKKQEPLDAAHLSTAYARRAQRTKWAAEESTQT
jgi:hypothetical protein